MICLRYLDQGSTYVHTFHVIVTHFVLTGPKQQQQRASERWEKFNEGRQEREREFHNALAIAVLLNVLSHLESLKIREL
jgi:hypothetical protein